MIVTKENVGAYAFAKHFLRLGLPDSINSLVGRLVGYVELQKGPADKTDLDVPLAFGNDVLRSKKVLIGCGGRYHQECSQPYSPVAKWIEEVDAALNDEEQQYGNLDEATKNRGSQSLQEEVASTSYCAPWGHGIHPTKFDGKGGPTLSG